MQVTIVGTSYVGLTTAVTLAYLGNQVTCIDRNPAVVESLQAGRVPLHEPGLQSLFTQARSRTEFSVKLTPESAAADVMLICVGTPPQKNGDTDLRYVEEAARAIGAELPPGSDVVVVNKSTVPVGSARRVASIIDAALEQRCVRAQVLVASNPEFLREGAALQDSFYPDRIVIGTNHDAAANRLHTLYRPILERTFPLLPGLMPPEGKPLPAFVKISPASAELAKYASNAFLATKISFANEISGLAERTGADITEVMRTVGLDSRIGTGYLGAGIGWGGSCFGKDVRALLALGQQFSYDLPLATRTIAVNDRQRRVVVDKLQQALRTLRSTTIALWGLAFKPNTDDLRDAPAIDIARWLLELGARVQVYDPVAMERARREYPQLALEYAPSPLAAVCNADAVALLTEWDEFLHVDWAAVGQQMHDRVVVDGRNVLNPELLGTLGFRYWGIGR